MKKAILFIITHLLCYSLVAQEQIQTLIQKLKDPESKSILVIAHRGDWRNAPENSLQAFKNCIEMGVHMIEIDLKKTKDGHLILMHDETIDRTTNGIGKPENYTLEEIRKFHLKNGLGIVTRHIIPTFEEVLKLCKGKILINVDKGYEYFKEVYALTEQSGTTEQVIIKSAYPLSKVKKENGDVLKKVVYMPIINLDQPNAERLVNEYLKISPIAIECCFQSFSPQVNYLLQKIRNTHTKIWINSLWPSLNAGHDDDLAVESNKPNEAWGWIISQGATLIQTDRPKNLLEYLSNNFSQ